MSARRRVRAETARQTGGTFDHMLNIFALFVCSRCVFIISLPFHLLVIVFPFFRFFTHGREQAEATQQMKKRTEADGLVDTKKHERQRHVCCTCLCLAACHLLMHHSLYVDLMPKHLCHSPLKVIVDKQW